MRKLLISICVGLLLSPQSRAENIISYEPAAAELSGTLLRGTFRHPNGHRYPFYFLKLSSAVNVEADGADSINVTEHGVSEIQLYSGSKTVNRELKSHEGKFVSVKGMVFHAHTAWHRRKLVMNVSELK